MYYIYSLSNSHIFNNMPSVETNKKLAVDHVDLFATFDIGSCTIQYNCTYKLLSFIRPQIFLKRLEVWILYKCVICIARTKYFRVLFIGEESPLIGSPYYNWDLLKNEWVWTSQFEVGRVKNTVKNCSCSSSYNNGVNIVNVVKNDDII